MIKWRIRLGVIALCISLFAFHTNKLHADSGLIASLPEIIYTQDPMPAEDEKVFFRKGSAEFVDPEEANETFDAQAAVLRKFQTFTVKIVGYTDDREVGSFDESLALGYRRAQIVWQNLVSRGIDPARLRVSSSGYRAFIFVKHDEKFLAGARYVSTDPDLPPPESR